MHEDSSRGTVMFESDNQKRGIVVYLENIINDHEINQWRELYEELTIKEIAELLPRIKKIKTKEEKRDKPKKRDPKKNEISVIIPEKETVCLIGEAGCGKTTSLRWLTLVFAEKGNKYAIPIYVDLTNFTSAYTDFEEFVDSILKSRRFPIENAKELLKKGYFVILVDGLDALSIEKIDMIGKFMISFPNNRFIFSSRKGNYYERIHIDKKWIVLPLDEEKKKACIKRYIGKKRADEFLDEIEKSSQKDMLEDLISNPFMLWMTVKIFLDNRKLPRNRTEIYQKYVRYFYEHNKKRKVRIEHERHTIESALSEAAFLMHCNNEFSIEEESICEFFKDVKNDCIKLNFISITEGISGNFVKFMPHPSFQEYFCAAKLKKLHEEKIDISITFTHPKWQNVLIFLSGLFEDSSSMVERIMEYDMGLASRCIESGTVNSSVRSDAISKLHKLAESKFAYERKKAIESLGRIGGDESVEVLIRELGNYKETSEVAEVFGNIKSEKAVDALIEKLSDEDSFVRGLAAEALGNIKSEKAVDALIEKLSDEDSFVREKAAEALGNIKSEKAVDALIEKLSDEDSDVRASAIEALGNIKSEKAVDALIEKLSDEFSDVQEWVTITLGKLIIEKAVDTLIEKLYDEFSDVQEMVAEALTRIKSEEVAGKLSRKLFEALESVRKLALSAMRETKSEEVVDSLIEELSDEDGIVQLSAAIALGKIKSEEVVDALIEKLSDERSDVQRLAMGALGNIESEKAVDALIEKLSDEDSFVREKAAEALRYTGNKKAVDALIERLSDKDGDVRASAVKAFIYMKSEKAVDALIERLSDKDGDVRKSAAIALGNIESEKAVDALIERLSDKFSDVREMAASALGNIESEKAVDALIERLSDKDILVRLEAIEALENIKSEKASDALIEKLSDEDSDVEDWYDSDEDWYDYLIADLDQDRYELYDSSDIQERAVEALGNIGTEKNIHKIENYLSNSEEYDNAYEAIQKIKLRESQEVKLRLTKKSIQKEEDVRRIEGFTTRLKQKEFTIISLYSIPNSTCTKEYHTVEFNCTYMNPLYPCMLQYFKSNNLYPIQITVRNKSDSKISDIKVSYKIRSTMDDFQTITLASNLKTGEKKSKGFTIDSKSLFGHEVSKKDLLIKVSFNNEEQQKLESQTTLTIASRNSILWSEKDKKWHELIAAFVTPNDPEIKEFIKTLGCEIVGYQLGKIKVLEQVKRIYEKLTEMDFTYISISKDLVGEQSVQMPCETLEPAGGNCIDGVLLFSSLCEKSNIHSAVVLVPGHALFAFKDSPHSNDYYILETTDISRKSFEDAVRDGFNCYRNGMKNPESVFVVDIENARKNGILPLDIP